MAKGGLDIAKLAERLAQLNKGGGGGEGGMSFMDIKDGRNVARVLPPINSKAEFALEVWVHYGVGKSANSPKGTMLVCPRTENENAYCPVCELSSQLKKMSSKKDDNNDKEARQIYRKKRVYYNAIDRADDLSKYEFQQEEGKPGKWMNTETGKPESPVKVLATGIEVYKSIIGFIIDPEYGDVTDPEEGLDIIITKTGTGQFGTKYEVKTARKNTPVGYPDWEKAMVDLSTLAKPKTVTEIEAIMEGKTPDPKEDKSDDEGNEDDGKPVDISDPDNGEEDDTADAIAKALARRKANQGK